MQIIYRNNDIVSNNADLEHLFTFNRFPAFMGCVEQDREKDIVHDMHWYISKTTGMIQLNPVLPLEIVYQTEHNPGTTGPGWLNHHKSFAEFISKYNPSNVFEIGGSHGILSEFCIEINKDINWTILEPNPIPVPGLRAQMQQGFFDDDTVIDPSVDMLVHSHVLEHVYNPDNFFKSLEKIKTGMYHCFSVPALQRHMEQLFTNVLNFEHTYFCTEEFIEYWLENSGFDVLEKKYYEKDHSIFYATVKTDKKTKKNNFPNSYIRNKVLINKYIDYHVNLVNSFNRKIRPIEQNVFLFGAHVFSQFLISFGLNEYKFECILDNSSSKQNKRLYGTNLKVQSPKILKNLKSPIVILRSGVFNKEIKSDILENINSTTIFLE